MDAQLELRKQLATIDGALLLQNNRAIEQSLQNCNLNEVLSQKAVSIARAEGKSSLVLFLCTLATHNDIEVERAQHWLDIYQSIIRKEPVESAQKLGENNALKMILNSIIKEEPLKRNELSKVKGKAQTWIDAIDLAVDSKEWKSATALLEALGSKPEETQTWLQIAKNLSQRHPMYFNETGLQKVDVDYNALARLYHLCAIAAQNAGAQKVATAIKQLEASAYETAGEYIKSIKILEQIHKDLPKSSAMVEMAKVKCKNGDLEGAIKHMDEAIMALEHPTEEDSALAQNFFESKTSEKSIAANGFNTFQAGQALYDLYDIIRDKELNIFLVSGTLLGCIREGDFLGHDKDIDVGLLGWEKQYDLCSAITQSGLFKYDAKFLKGQDTYYLPIQHKPTGLWIDVFFYHQNNGKWTTGVDFFFGYRQTFTFTPFELQEKDFVGVDVLIPKDYKLNLNENFGDWEKPDPSYLSHIESPSTDNTGSPAHMLTIRLATYQSIIKKDANRIKKIIQINNDLKSKSLAMNGEVTQHLENFIN
jgi:tetratricopeptide (TPR) repeat protein